MLRCTWRENYSIDFHQIYQLSHYTVDALRLQHKCAGGLIIVMLQAEIWQGERGYWLSNPR